MLPVEVLGLTGDKRPKLGFKVRDKRKCQYLTVALKHESYKPFHLMYDFKHFRPASSPFDKFTRETWKVSILLKTIQNEATDQPVEKRKWSLKLMTELRPRSTFFFCVYRKSLRFSMCVETTVNNQDQPNSFSFLCVYKRVNSVNYVWTHGRLQMQVQRWLCLYSHWVDKWLPWKKTTHQAQKEGNDPSP